MEDNVIKVSVRPNKQNSVKVSSNVVSTPITANSDTSQLWSQVSKNWATSEVIVDNTDYSSKYYANKAKESANNAQGFESTIRDVYNGFLGETSEAIENVQGAREEAIANIETARIDAVDNITTVKSESIASVEAKSNEVLSTVNAGIVEINNTKTTILQDLEFVANGEKQEINELAEKAKDDIESTGVTSRADIDLSNLSAIGQAKFDAKVNKSGDTMTGELVGNVVNSPYPFIAQSNIMDITTTPTAHQYIGYDFRDKNNARIGWAGVVSNTNGSKYFQIQNLGGVNGFQFPMCTTKPTTTPTASNYHVSAVTQNYVNGTSGYIVFSDKLCIQWGQHVNSTGGNGTQNTITFLKSFANANYMIQRTNIGVTGDGPATIYTTIKSKTASNFVAITTTTASTTTFSWLAIGYIA